MYLSVTTTIALLVLCAGMSVGQTASISLASGSTTPGASIALPLSLSTSAGGAPSALQWTLSYSTTDFAAVNLSLGASAGSAGKTLDCANVAAGKLACALYGLNKTTMLTGTMATATLTVAGSTSSVSSNIQISGPVASSADGGTIGATASGATVTIAQPKVNSLSCSPSTVQGPATSSCTVALLNAAPAGGVSVGLGYVNTGGISVTMPTSVTVVAGATSASFTAQVGAASSTSTVTVSASAGGVTKAAAITVNPASTITITLSPSSATLA